MLICLVYEIVDSFFQRLLKSKGFYHRDLFILCIHTFTSSYILYRKTKESSWKRLLSHLLSSAIFVVFLGKKKSNRHTNVLACQFANQIISHVKHKLHNVSHG